MPSSSRGGWQSPAACGCAGLDGGKLANRSPNASGCVMPAGQSGRRIDGREKVFAMAEISVNGRCYRVPERPVVVICFDGCDPAYIERGIADGILPTIAGFQRRGFYAIRSEEH